MWSWPADLAPPVVSPEEARRAAEQILARPEYQEPQPSLFERILDAIGRFLRDAIEGLAGSGPGGVVATLVVAGLVAVAVWFLLRSLGVGRRRVAAPHEPVAHGTSVPTDPATWLAEAERLAAARDHRNALRCRYQAAVAAFVRDGTVDDVPGRTPRELAAELVVLAPDVDALARSVTERFERAWYGGGPVDAGGYVAFARDLGDLEAVVAGADRRLATASQGSAS